VRRRAVAALVGVGPEAGPAVGWLVIALKDDDATVRRRAAEAVGWLESDEKGIAPALAEPVRRGPDRAARAAAGQALRRVAKPGAIHELSEMRSDKDPFVRATALTELARKFPHKVVADLLVEALKDPDAVVRTAAAEALGRIGLPQAHVVPA